MKIRNSGEESPLSTISDDEDDLAGRRLVADPDSPTSKLLERAAQRSLRDAELTTPERRFSYVNDIARNPKLAAAARMEFEAASGVNTPLSGTPGSGGLPSAVSGTTTPIASSAPQTISVASSSMTYFQHGSEIDRQSIIITKLDQSAAEESKINQGMAAVMLGRLQSARAAAERILSMLQAFASAEEAYGRALTALSGLTLTGDGDGPSLRAAIAAFSPVPRSIGNSHNATAVSLVSAVQSVRVLVDELRAACDHVGQGANTAQRQVDTARRTLKAALATHRDACRAFDVALLERQKVGSRSRAVEADPWVAEGRLVERQAELQGAQTHQRRYLAGAFRRVGELERRRVEATCNALAAILEMKGAHGAQRHVAYSEALTEALSEVDCESDLESFTATAGNSVRNGDALSARQSDMVDHMWRELFSSAEIVRQGDLHRLEESSGSKKEWARGYGVLTRAGFLHLFAFREGEPAGMTSCVWTTAGGPMLSFNLARCEFEQGEAPSWRLIEAPAGGLNGWLGPRARTVMLRTNDIDEAMDWAADLREVIAVCSS